MNVNNAKNAEEDPSGTTAMGGGGDYHFDQRHLSDPNDDLRRFAIIEISRRRMNEFEDKLIHCLKSTEKNDANRRHIVRALGNIGTSTSIAAIRPILEKGEGLIVGEAAEALAKLGDKDALQTIGRLVDSPIQFVATKAKWADGKLRQGG